MSGMDVVTLAAHPKAFIYRSTGWSSPRSADRHLRSLEERGLISAEKIRADDSWVACLTEKGKEILTDDIDPERYWGRNWDGKWTLLSFDLSQDAFRERKQLDDWLKKRRFGHLQGSLWISHRKYQSWTDELERRRIDPRAIVFQEATPVGRMTSKRYVAKAWSFDRINQAYLEYIEFMDPDISDRSISSVDWHKRGSSLWWKAFQLDPFLPESLLPSGYLGKEAWAIRQRTFAQFC